MERLEWFWIGAILAFCAVAVAIVYAMWTAPDEPHDTDNPNPG